MLRVQRGGSPQQRSNEPSQPGRMREDSQTVNHKSIESSNMQNSTQHNMDVIRCGVYRNNYYYVGKNAIYRLDAETEGSTGFRNPKARGCSARAQRGRY